MINTSTVAHQGRWGVHSITVASCCAPFPDACEGSPLRYLQLEALPSNHCRCREGSSRIPHL